MLTMNSKRAIEILGIVAGIAGFLDGLIKKDFLIAGLIAVAALAWIAYFYFAERPPFSILEVRREVTFTDAQTNTRLQTVLKVRSNHRGLTEYWFRNLSADGTIANIRVDGTPPGAADIVVEANVRRVRKAFQHPLARNEEKTIRLEFEANNSFPGEHVEGIVSLVTGPTTRVQMTVHFHATKPCLRYRLMRRYGGEEDKLLEEGPASDNGTTVDITVVRPPRGSELYLEWEW